MKTKKPKKYKKTSDETEMTPKQIVQFIEDIQQMKKLVSTRSKLISIKIPEGLLKVFRQKCEIERVPYQTQIKLLMQEWLKK